MRNPLIFLGQVTGTECHGHHVGLTWHGRLVLVGHPSVAHVGAARALSRLAGGSRHSLGCAEILAAVRASGQHRTGRQRLRAMGAIDRRDLLRLRVHRSQTVPCTSYSALELMIQVGLLEPVPLEMWDIVRK